jgi:hypothetical protein
MPAAVFSEEQLQFNMSIFAFTITISRVKIFHAFFSQTFSREMSIMITTLFKFKIYER